MDCGMISSAPFCLGCWRDLSRCPCRVPVPSREPARSSGLRGRAYETDPVCLADGVVLRTAIYPDLPPGVAGLVSGGQAAYFRTGTGHAR